jgi:hypothetical protein
MAAGIDRCTRDRLAIISELRDRTGKLKIDNPLEDLDRKELGRLQSLSVNAWSDDVSRSLHRIDIRRICVDVKPRLLQGLPQNTAMLRIDLPDADGPVLDLSRFTDLRYLQIDAWYAEGEPKPRTVVDMATLNAPGLESLRIAGEIRNAQAMARLKSLRRLELADATGIDSLDFVRELNGLEGLSVRKVADLRPLAGLGQLTSVDAYASDVTLLPLVAMPALRLLDVLSSPVDAAQVEKFARLNPQCRLRHRYVTELRNVITDATEIRILKHHETVRVVRSPAEISSLVATLQIEEPELQVSKIGGHFRCTPETVFEVVTPTATHRVAPVGPGYLRLIGAVEWPADARLRPESRIALAKWLEKQGLDGKCCGE